MLYEFLQEYRAEILALAEEKTLKLAGSLPSSEKLKMGLPIFFEQLIAYMKNPDAESSEKIFWMALPVTAKNCTN